MNGFVGIGLILLAWGGFLFLGARPLHARTKDMVQWMRRNGVDPAHIPGTVYFGSPRGLRGLRRVGLAVLAAGLALVVIGAIRGAAGSTG